MIGLECSSAGPGRAGGLPVREGLVAALLRALAAYLTRHPATSLEELDAAFWAAWTDARTAILEGRRAPRGSTP